MIEIFEASTNGSSCGSCPYTPRKLGKRKRTLNSTLIQDRRELRVAVEFPNWSMEGEPMHPPVNVQLRRVRLSRHRSLSSPLDTASWGVCTGKMKTQHCCTGGYLSRRIPGPAAWCPLQRESEIRASRVMQLSVTPTPLPGARGRTSSCAGPSAQ